MSSEDLWTPPRLVEWITKRFNTENFPEPIRLEAEKLVAHALGISRLDIYLQYDKPTSEDEQKALRELVRRRLKREPLGYILGCADFWSLTLSVGPGILIPRRETEILIETVLELFSDNTETNDLTFLELGTGSGAIPIALATEIPGIRIDSVDISPKAIETAERNLKTYATEIESQNSEVRLFPSDLFRAISTDNTYDLIVSNPPYIPGTDIEDLQPEVRDWEPREALDGGEKGLDIIIYLAESAKDRLKGGGYLAFEHGYDQKNWIKEALTHPWLELTKEVKDYSGNDRVLVYRKKD